MKFFTVAVTALAALPSAFGREYPKAFDHSDYKEVSVSGGSQHPSEKTQHPKHDELTEQFVCEKLSHFATDADFIYELVKVLECGDDRHHCWEPVRKALYELEFELDLFDTAIDESDLTKCWACHDESKIACCYRRYAESLIRTLIIISEKLEHLNGETAFFIVTAVNSLRAADYTFVYELVRRMQCEKYQLEIFEKQGAVDGSTPGSIRAAFALFVSTPYITGEEFKILPGEKPRESDIEIVEEIKCKNKPDCGKHHSNHKYHNKHHDQHHHGHHKHHGHHNKHHSHHKDYPKVKVSQNNF